MTTDSTEEMRRQVNERVEAEKSQLPLIKEPPTITSKYIRDCLHMNELGDGTLYAAEFCDRLVYVKNLGEWFEWAGHYWRRDDMNRSLALVERISERYLDEYKLMAEEIASLVKSDPEEKGGAEAKRLQNLQGQILKRVSQLRADKRRTACLKFAHTIDDPIAITGEEFDAQPMLFPCANGVIDLETGILKPGRPRDYLSKASPIAFLDIDTPAPRWEKALLEIFDSNQDLVAYIQRLFGYAMTGLTDEKVFPIFYGKTGWNGRSLIVNTISHVMGALAGTIPSEMLLSSKFTKSASGPSPDIMSLKGLRMAFASETDEGHRFSASKVKWLTGKDELVGRNPHDKYETRFQPTHKLFLMTNNEPAAPANDKAFWERVQQTPFKISFVNREPQEHYERRAIIDLDRQVREEAAGILAWLVRGCLLYQKHGLKPPREVTEATEEYRRGEDLLADYIDECCIREPLAKEKASILYTRFVDWYHDNIGQKHPTGTWFGKQLALKYEKNKSEGCVVYHGIALKSTQGE